MKLISSTKWQPQQKTIITALLCATFFNAAYADINAEKKLNTANEITKQSTPAYTSIESLITEEPPKNYIGKSKNPFVGPPRFNDITNPKHMQVAMIDKSGSTNSLQYTYQPPIEFQNTDIDHYSNFNEDNAKGQWILVDSNKETISVMRDNKPKLILHNISIGRNGITTDKIVNDEKTPIGKFKINRINNNSQYKLFFGINYPTSSYAKQAYLAEKIDTTTYLAISEALKNNSTPPQTTDLGGYLGIHGLGKADPKIHKQLNWTKGCVAITNKQIMKLRKYINIGTIVIIK